MKTLLAYQQEISWVLSQNPGSKARFEELLNRLRHIRQEMLARSDLAMHVCTKSAMFQVPQPLGSSTNMQLGRKLKQRFPLGVNESHPMYGLFHIHETMLPGVVRILARQATEVELLDLDDRLVVAGAQFYP